MCSGRLGNMELKHRHPRSTGEPEFGWQYHVLRKRGAKETCQELGGRIPLDLEAGRGKGGALEGGVSCLCWGRRKSKQPGSAKETTLPSLQILKVTGELLPQWYWEKRSSGSDLKKGNYSSRL